MRITVLTGGATVERVVAFAGATQVVTALRGRGHRVHVVDIATGLLTAELERRFLQTDVGTALPAVQDLVAGERRMLSGELARIEEVRDADVLFLVVHGGAGEGGILQGVLEVIGTPRAAIGGRVARVLTQVGLASKATAYPKELSGGEQQRVAFARALVNDPFVLIADEPTGNLDDRASRGIFQLLREINASGTAVMMATHDLDLVRANDYRTIELDHGEVVFDSAETPKVELDIE